MYRSFCRFEPAAKVLTSAQAQGGVSQQAEKVLSYGLYIKDDNLFYTDVVKTTQLTSHLIMNDEKADRWHQISAAQLASAITQDTRQYQKKNRIFYPDQYHREPDSYVTAFTLFCRDLDKPNAVKISSNGMSIVSMMPGSVSYMQA